MKTSSRTRTAGSLCLLPAASTPPHPLPPSRRSLLPPPRGQDCRRQDGGRRLHRHRHSFRRKRGEPYSCCSRFCTQAQEIRCCTQGARFQGCCQGAPGQRFVVLQQGALAQEEVRHIFRAQARLCATHLFVPLFCDFLSFIFLGSSLWGDFWRVLCVFRVPFLEHVRRYAFSSRICFVLVFGTCFVLNLGAFVCSIFGAYLVLGFCVVLV